MKIRKLAGIDIGSNAMRLLVMNVITDDRGRKPIYRKSSLVRVPVRLGADTFLTGEISEASVDRMIKAMRSFSLLMEVHGVEDYRACATSAMREATNGSAVAQKVFEESGIKIELIDGKKEAAIIFIRCLSSYFLMLRYGIIKII